MMGKKLKAFFPFANNRECKTNLFLDMIIIFLPFFLCCGPPKNESITIVYDAPPTTFDPHLKREVVNQTIMSNIYEAFVCVDANMQLQPILASYWEKLDKTTWRFQLRQGVTFHNNKKLTVQDVLYSFFRVWQNPQSEYRAFTWYVDTIYADDNAIIFKLKIPYAFFLYDIAGLFIVPEGFDAQKELPIGTGPYRCIKLSAEEIKMQYYEHYWGGAVPIKYARFIFIPDYKKRLEILNNGKADIINFIPLSAVSALEKNSQVVATPGNSIRYLEFNLAKYPFNQKKFREAINLAIDREYIARVVSKGYAIPANQYLPPGVLGFNSNLPQITYHPEQAKKFLQKIADIPPKIPIVWEKEIYGISRRIIWKPRVDERIMIKEIRLKQPDKDELAR